MEIDYLKMKNFRQYCDVTINFSKGMKNFTIVQGANGAGKTNILNAITWCLFGEEYHIDSKYRGLPIVSTTALDEKTNQLVETMVELQLIQNDGKKIVITRSIFCRESEGTLEEVASMHPPPCVMRETERDWVGPIYGDDAQYIIESLIPSTIEEYFFFDGERMDDYFKENTGSDIRSAVFKISQLDLFNKLIDHLTIRKNDFVKKTRGLSSKAEDVRARLEIHEKSIKVDRNELEDYEKKRDEAELLERDFSQKLANSSLEHIRDLEEQREILESDINRLKSEIIEREDERLKLLHKVMPTIFAYGPLLKTKKLIDGRTEAGLIPPLIQTIFIKGLLKKNRCICYSDISNKNEYSSARRKKVEMLLESSEISEMSNELMETNIRIQEMLEGLKNFPEDIMSTERRLNTLYQLKEERNEKCAAISYEIKQTNLENIRKWEEERQKYSQEKAHFNEKIGLKKHQIDRRGNIIRALNIELKQELKRENKHKSLIELFTFCEESISCANQIKERIMQQVKEEVEKKASEQFLSLIWKKNTYTGVEIDEDYNISVPHVSGREALGTLSAGERQVCALSFFLALNSVSGFQVPIIIDTPLARISREPRKNIAENLPNYLTGTQVTLLMTGEEYTKEVKEALSKKVDKRYLINFSEKGAGKLAEVKLEND
ncbi:MAG: AAA family ATPase [Candidatus Bathyarchaeota archaeon]